VLVPCFQAALKIPGRIAAHAEAVVQYSILFRSGLGSKHALPADMESSVIVQLVQAHTR
jgi:hypothetical protein